ncbi:MAG: hypothetical protein Q9M92_10580 [Enterobacterales bacterium]|nr:hypothetical protein [Enterobacterales bacterium]
MQLKHNLIRAKDDYVSNLLVNSFVAILLLGLLMIVSVKQSSALMGKVRISEIYFNVKSIQQAINIESIKTGQWPAAYTINGSALGLNSVDHLSFNGAGRLDFYLDSDYLMLAGQSAKPLILSFVAARDLNSTFSSTIWLCGYATPPNSFTPLAKNLTNIDLKYLPFSCR